MNFHRQSKQASLLTILIAWDIRDFIGAIRDYSRANLGCHSEKILAALSCTTDCIFGFFFQMLLFSSVLSISWLAFIIGQVIWTTVFRIFANLSIYMIA